MHVSTTDAATFLVLSLASGRVAYSITKDEIFRPAREWVWKRSAPESGTILERDMSGDRETPARQWHLTQLDEPSDAILAGAEPTGTCADMQPGGFEYAYEPAYDLREPGFFGQLLECPYCLSFWTSLVATLAWWALGDTVIIPALPLAVWGAANTYAVKGL